MPRDSKLYKVEEDKEVKKVKKTGRKMVKMWTVIFVVNAAILYLISILLPNFVVLGNDSLSVFAALIVSSLILTLILTQVYPLIKTLKIKADSELFWSFIYTIANIGALWLIARGATHTGFGISSFLVAIELGIVLVIAQYFIWKRFPKGK